MGNGKKGKRSKRSFTSRGRGNAECKTANRAERQESSAPGGASKKYDEARDMTSLNDVSWYTHNPGLVLPTASVPYPYRPGMSFPAAQVVKGTGSLYYNERIPGVMALAWVPAVGFSDGVLSPPSIAAKEIYAKVRSKFSGALDADAPDFLIYMICLDSIFSYIAALKRIYRCLDAYSPNNFATPNDLLLAMGISLKAQEDLRAHKADFLYAINQLTLASRKFAMPNTMDYFNRHYWLNDNVYTDDATINSQFFCFVQTGFFKFTLLDATGSPAADGASGATLTDAPWSNATGTDVAGALYNFGNALISALAESDDAYTISGYLMRAYEGAPQFIVAELAGDEKLLPVYVPEVLSQIENAEPVGGSATPSHGLIRANVWQDPATNAILSYPTISGGSAAYTAFTNFAYWQHLLSVRADVPTVGDTLIATRFKAAMYTGTQVGSDYDVSLYPGSEILLTLNLIDGRNAVMST